MNLEKFTDRAKGFLQAAQIHFDRREQLAGRDGLFRGLAVFDYVLGKGRRGAPRLIGAFVLDHWTGTVTSCRRAATLR